MLGNCQHILYEVGSYSHTVHTDDIGHCEKRSESGADFGEEVAPLSLFALQEWLNFILVSAEKSALT